MARRVSSTELKNRTRDVLDWARVHGEAVIIESYGKPQAVLMSYEAYRQIEADRERRRERFDQMVQEVRRRTSAVSEEELDRAIAEAVEAVRRDASKQR